MGTSLTRCACSQACGLLCGDVGSGQRVGGTPLTPKEREALNAVLDQWTSKDVELLQRKFTSNTAGSHTLTRDTFVNALPGLQGLPKACLDAFFAAFDANGDSAIDFREFCVALAKANLGPAYDRVCWLHNVFHDKRAGSKTAWRMLLHFVAVQVQPDAADQDAWITEQLQQVQHEDSIPLESFSRWVAQYDLARVLQPFEVVPHPGREQAVIHELVKDWNYKEGDTAYIVAADWWSSWANYTGFTTEHPWLQVALPDVAVDRPIARSLLLESPRPGAIDTCTDPDHPALVKAGSQLGRDFVAVPAAVWEWLLQQYGLADDSSILARTVVRRMLDVSPVAKVSAGADEAGAAEDGETAEGGTAVDGAVEDGTVEDGTVKDGDAEPQTVDASAAAAEAGVAKVAPAEATDVPSTAVQAESGAVTVVATIHVTGGDRASTAAGKSAKIQPVVVESAVDIAQLELELHPVSFKVWLSSVEGLPFPGSNRELHVSRSAKQKELLSLASTLFGSELENSQLWYQPLEEVEPWRQVGEGDSADQPASALLGGHLLLEYKYLTRRGDRIFPSSRRKPIDEFRDFQLGDRVDACDFQGQWYTGTIVEPPADAPEGVRVHFDRFKSRYDESYPADSPKLQPLGTRTFGGTALPQPHTPTEQASSEGGLEGATGLYNLGNTCFMNSVVQCLSNTPLLSQFIRNGVEGEVNEASKFGTGGTVAMAFSEVVRALWGTDRAITPISFKRVLDKHRPLFSDGMQHDAQELLSALLDAIHEDLNHAGRDSVTVDDAEEDTADEGDETKVESTANQASGRRASLLDSAVAEGNEGDESPPVAALGGWTNKAEGELPGGANRETQPASQDDSTYANPLHTPSANSALVPVAATPDRPGAVTPSGITPATSPFTGSRVGRSLSGRNLEIYRRNSVTGLSESLMREARLGAKAWAQHKSRNCSVIVDLFHGLMRSTMVCPVCKAESSTFDPFMSLSLPIPVETEKALTLTVVPISQSWLSVRQVDSADAAADTSKPHSRVASASSVAVSFPGSVVATDDVVPTQEAEPSEAQPEPAFGPGIGKLPPLPDSTSGTTSAEPATVPAGGAGIGAGAGAVASAADAGRTAPSSAVRWKYGVMVPHHGICGEVKYKLALAIAGGRAGVERHTPAIADDKMLVFLETSRSLRLVNDAVSISRYDANTKLVAYEVPSDLAEIDGHPPAVQEEHADKQRERQFRDFAVGDRVDAQDYQHKWYPATVIKVNSEEKSVTVHYDRFRARWDEDVPMNSARLAPVRSHTPQDVDVIKHVAMLHRFPTKQKDGSTIWTVSGQPFVLFYSSMITCTQLHALVLHTARKFMADTALEQLAEDEEKLPYNLKYVNASGTGCTRCQRKGCIGCAVPVEAIDPRLRPGDALVLDWTTGDHYSAEPPQVREDSSVPRVRAKMEELHRNQTEGIALSGCLDTFTRAEVLGKDQQWTCEKCKEPRRGLKTISLWKMPDVLVIHLKRFYYSVHYKKKLDAIVDFPVKGLNLDPWCSSAGKGPGQSNLYDLYAVVNHSGNLGGGHYTAYCRNSTGGVAKWIHFNDRFVSEVPQTKVVSNRAYCLFYKRRQVQPHNLVNFTTAL